MTKRYYILASRDDARAPWGIEFGDYEVETVEDEKADMVDSGWKAGNLKIMRLASDAQSTIDAAILTLNNGRQ